MKIAYFLPKDQAPPASPALEVCPIHDCPLVHGFDSGGGPPEICPECARVALGDQDPR